MEDAEPSDSAHSGLIAGRFRVGGLLGSGGSASVFEAVDTTTGRRMAVKLLHPHLARSDALRHAFLDEAMRARGLHHPHVVEMIDVGTFVDGDLVVVWIAQEYVPGVTLAEHVRHRGAISPAQSVELGVSLLSAVSAAHSLGLVHRDVSPNNVMVVVEGDAIVDVKLLDFGLADIVGATAVGGDVLRSAAVANPRGVVGNIGFASPEQLRGEAIDERGDIYQVGGVLYFALTGRRPFESPDREAVIRAHLNSPPPVPSVRAPGIPAELDRIIVRALLKSPADRFPDADAMRFELERLVVTASAAPATTVTRVWSSPTAAPLSAPAQTPARADGGDDRRSAGWIVALSAAALLAAVAIAVPLLMPSGAAPPLPSSSAVAEPSVAPSAAPVASTVPVVDAVSVVVPGAATLPEAVSALGNAGLVVGAITHVDAPAAEGTVLQMEPAAGTIVRAGSVVAMTIASGSNAVPATGGLSATDAIEVVRAAGFDARETLATSSEAPAGAVLGTDPAGGSSQRVGSVVRVLVAGGRGPGAPPSPSPEPSDAHTPSPTISPGT